VISVNALREAFNVLFITSWLHRKYWAESRKFSPSPHISPLKHLSAYSSTHLVSASVKYVKQTSEQLAVSLSQFHQGTRWN